jgi:hypothetical protein
MTTRIPRGLAVAGTFALVVVVALGSSGATAPRGSASMPVLLDSVPTGWIAAGSKPQDYVMVVDHTVMRDGRPSARIESRVPQVAGFGTLMQQIAADAYRGERVRLSGDVRVRDVIGGASLWMRVDGAGNDVLAFDNASERAARGTAEWKHFDVVLDVPDKAQTVAFGILLQGGGTAWASALEFEKVPRTTALTGRDMTRGIHLPAAPVNLGFDAGRP